MKSSDFIRVGVRMRPLIARERKAKESQIWLLDTATQTILQKSSFKNNSEGIRFNFNNVFDGHSPTEEVYNVLAKDIVISAMNGINGTVFAYGQTSSGKTYTIKGDGESLGVIELAMNDVFSQIKESKNREFSLHMTYIEIYNETVRDLLNPEELNFPIYESKERGVYITNLNEVPVKTAKEVLMYMQEGEAHRHYGRTNMNDFSSRSHTLLTLLITSKQTEAGADPSKIRSSSLNFVDLAGSERLAQTKATGQQAEEGRSINKSLMFLGIVISRLSENQKHIPYRDSKLTRILQSSLGGNSRTAIICNIGPGSQDREHTVSTLRFGSRAIKIRNFAEVNEVVDPDYMNSLDRELLVANQERVKELELKVARLQAILLHQSTSRRSLALEAGSNRRQKRAHSLDPPASNDAAADK
jgi:centromeric protein E